MSVKTQRKFFSVNSIYQWQLLALTIIPVVLGYFLLSGFVNFFMSQVFMYASQGIPYEGLITRIAQMTIKLGFILIAYCFIFGLLALALSQNLIGPFDRINRELDDIIAGRSKKIIVVRPRDKLAQTLLKRVNVLIESYGQKS